MPKIARYLPVLKKKKDGGYRASVHKDPYGKYILFETHVNKVERLKKEVERGEYFRKKVLHLEEENERLRMQLRSIDYPDFG